jgi:nitroimidazol reductase NimA-like FMN-containing flavoprotein (pyridoxamine 5'-phosphate oxidase superfamily)
MPEADTLAMLQQGFAGRLAVIGTDGYPYCVPLLYLWLDGEVWLHTTGAHGHLRSCIDAETKACFEIDEPEEVFPYGRFECDTGLAYRSVILFGKIRVAEDENAKQRFFETLMGKYANPSWQERPPGFFPRMHQITLYAFAIERMTGKRTPLPDLSNQWPASDRTVTPNADPNQNR